MPIQRSTPEQRLARLSLDQLPELNESRLAGFQFLHRIREERKLRHDASLKFYYRRVTGDT